MNLIFERNRIDLKALVEETAALSRVFKFILPLLVVFFVVLLLPACSPANQEPLHFSGPTMGTSYNIKYVPLDGVDAGLLQKEVDALLVHINELMSTYDPNSELSLFNNNTSTEEILLSAETIEVMAEALRIGKISNGYLDITVGPLVNLWGFGPKGKRIKVPANSEIESAISASGMDKLTLTESGAIKSHSDLYVDLSTVAKGYAVDRIAGLLDSKGITNFLVEVGGEMKVSGKKPAGDWVVAVEKPVTNERAIQRLLKIGNNAIATSGDYRNYFEENGVRYSHLIDPKTGLPIKHNLVAVTVVHESSMTADALATAITVMGKEQGLKMALKNNLSVLLITKENGEFREYTTPRFEPFIDK